jgi:hypothetical protein
MRFKKGDWVVCSGYKRKYYGEILYESMYLANIRWICVEDFNGINTKIDTILAVSKLNIRKIDENEKRELIAKLV